MNTQVTPIDNGDEIDLQYMFAHITQNRWWILACMVAATAILSTYAFFARPMYRVTAVLMPAASGQVANRTGLAGGMLGSLAGDFGFGGPHNSRTEQALAVLQSREFTESFISDEHLMPQLFPNEWNASAGRWDVPVAKRPTLAEAYDYFNKKIRTITEHKRTGLITLQIEWTSSQEAAKWINELIDRLNQEMRKRAITKADASMQFLAAQLQNTSNVEVRNAIGYLMEAELKKRMLAQVTPDYSLQFVAPPVGTDGAAPVWPKKILLLILGPVVGFLLAVPVTFLRRHGSAIRT
jgi:uncharacterized protein involved in exopolysaccharide biosynthesis